MLFFPLQNENFSQSDVERLMSQTEKKDYVGVDILLSSDWPSDVAIGTSPPVSTYVQLFILKNSFCGENMAVIFKLQLHFILYHL